MTAAAAAAGWKKCIDVTHTHTHASTVLPAAAAAAAPALDSNCQQPVAAAAQMQHK